MNKESGALRTFIVRRAPPLFYAVYLASKILNFLGYKAYGTSVL